MTSTLPSSNFLWVANDEPHARRRMDILARYPEILELYGPNRSAAYKVSRKKLRLYRTMDVGSASEIVVVVSIQVATACCMPFSSWPLLILLSYIFGAFCNHNLFLAIHELSHNLAFTSCFNNRLLGMFANIPIGVPMSVTFQKYHLDHHRFQGVDGIDVDLPTESEGFWVANTAAKMLWVTFQLFFYAVRPLFVNPKPPGRWEALNFVAQLTFDIVLTLALGWKPLTYLLLSTFLGGGLHPMAGHFIAEHYVFSKDQETYSYYGVLNRVAWNVGYHNEHHDFPRIPGCRLHRVKEIAPEYYEGLASHNSWSWVLYKYITDPAVGPFSRVKRKPCRSKAE